MKNIAFLIYVMLLVDSCKESTNGGSESAVAARPGTESSLFKLQLNPTPNVVYHYEISSQSDTRLEAEGKEINNISRTNIGVSFTINKDSLGNYLFTTRYDKLKVYTKNNNQESELDADHATQTFDPVEKMLGLLKQSEITTTITPQGEMKSVTGYQELTDKIMAAFTNSDVTTQSIVKSRWQQLIEEGVMKKSTDQLFSLFPDSAVKIGDKWTLQSTQKGEINLNVTTTCTLEEISNGKAIITSESKLSRDPSAKTIMGFELTGDLNGRQTGESEVDIKTGMLVKSSMTGTIKGKLQIMGREIPLSIKNKVTMTRR